MYSFIFEAIKHNIIVPKNKYINYANQQLKTSSDS